MWIIRSKRKLWQLLFPAGISVKEIKTNSCKQCLMLTGVISIWLRILKQHLLFFIVNWLRSMLYASHWKQYLNGIIQENLGYHKFFVIPLKRKNKLYIKSIKHKFLHNETVYKNYRNHLNKLLKVAEKKYYSDLISKYKRDSKKVWSIIKTVIKKDKNNQLQKQFRLGDGSLTTDMKLICNQFN